LEIIIQYCKSFADGDELNQFSSLICSLYWAKDLANFLALQMLNSL